MSQFIARVTLHGADSGSKSWEEYEKLHKEMQKFHFRRTITGASGRKYNLPHAEYHISGDIQLRTVLSNAKNAANVVTDNNSVFVSKFTTCAWIGLDPE